LTLPAKYRRRLRTTNIAEKFLSVERFIEEIRRRETVIRIFPNLASARRCYLIMDAFFEWKSRLDTEPGPPDSPTISTRQPAAVAA
jgi:transposase-like protein